MSLTLRYFFCLINLKTNKSLPRSPKCSHEKLCKCLYVNDSGLLEIEKVDNPIVNVLDPKSLTLYIYFKFSIKVGDFQSFSFFNYICLKWLKVRDICAARIRNTSQSGMIHDLTYDQLGITGAGGLFTAKKAIGADYKFVTQELAIALSPAFSARSRFTAGALGLGLGAAALPKSLIPTISQENWTNTIRQAITPPSFHP